MSDDTRLSACNCFATRRAARTITRLYERHLSAAGLTSAQFSILALTDERGSETMSELARILAMDRTTLLRAMKPMQRERLLGSRANVEDPRQLVFFVTAIGQRRLREALGLWQEAQREFEAQVGSERAARLRRDLLSLGGTS
jgi:DNA-binding MarR family transcriptional regulator